jgi:hypothetical protein
VTVNDVSPLSAAVRLLTFGAMIPIGSVIAGALMGKGRVPPCWVVMTLLSRISTSTGIDSTQYGFQVMAGIGTGFINAGLIILVPYIMEKRDLGKYSCSHH